MHRTSSQFWAAYRRLPRTIQDQADSAYALLKTDAKHPSLHLKKAGVYWSVRIGLRYRALAVEADDGLVWFWIGNHADYDALISGRRRG